MEYAIRIRTALKHAARCALGARAPALPLALLRATVDARRLHRAAPYTEVQALALHTHTRKERSELGSERSSDRPGTPIWGESQGAGSASRRRQGSLWLGLPAWGSAFPTPAFYFSPLGSTFPPI